jgi:hypothetical protein
MGKALKPWRIGMAKRQDQTGKTTRVIDLQKAKYNRMVLKAFDDMTHEERRKEAELRAETERKARHRL